jgi:four helix bundle protein
MQDFKRLTVWQSARRLSRSVYELTASFPAIEEFGLKTQMRRAAVSICANIAEGAGRRGDREFRRFLDHAIGSSCELECELILSFDLAFITEPRMNKTAAHVAEIRRMLSGLINQLAIERPGAQKAAHPPSPANRYMPLK